jgi:hypothetical protein
MPNGTGGQWTTGNTINGSFSLDMGNIFTATGQAIGGGASGDVYATTAVNAAIGAGLVTPAELSAGAGGIHHALFISSLCQTGSTVYPGNSWNNEGPCIGGTAPPLGARIWSDVSCSTVASWTAENAPEKAILCALNQYGAIIGDSGAGTGNITDNGLGIMTTVGGEASYQYGAGDQWSSLAASYGWTAGGASGELQTRWSATNNMTLLGASSAGRWAGGHRERASGPLPP